MEITIDVVKEFEKYKLYLSSCLKTPELNEDQKRVLARELEWILQSCKDTGNLSVKKNTTE